MIRFRPVLNSYLARHYAWSLLGMLAVFTAIMGLFDSIEQLRLLNKAGQARPDLIIYVTMLRLPQNVLVIAPFIVLFAGMWSITHLTKRQEFVVMRMAGASLWQLLMPLFIVAFCYGVLLVAVVNPLAAATERAYQTFREQSLRGGQGMITLLHRGLWLRQPDAEKSGQFYILHAGRVKVPGWELSDVMVLFFDSDHRFLKRFDAPAARLVGGQWVFPKAQSTELTGPVDHKDLKLKTQLTVADLEESFMSSETISVWAMPRFMQMLQSTGFSALPLQVRFGSLLMLPILCMALVMVAASVSLRPSRQGGQVILAVTGVVAGFLIFFLGNFLQALGASGQIPVLLAATSPALLTLSVGTLAILNIEDR